MEKIHNNMTDRIISEKKALFFVSFIIVSITVLAFLTALLLKNNNEFKSSLSHDWTISINSKEVYKGSIQDYKFPSFHKNDKLSFITKVDHPLEAEQSLVVNVPFSKVNVYVDGIKSYSFDEHNKAMAASAVLEAPLLKASKGSIVKVEVIPSLDAAFNNINNFLVINRGTLESAIVSSAPQTLFISCFLILLGIMLVLISILTINELYSVFFIGLYSMCSGLWVLCCSKLLQLFSWNYMFNTYAEFYSLYVCGIIFCLLQISFVSKRKYRKAVYLSSAFMCTYTIGAIILSATNFITIAQPLFIFQVLECLTNIIFLVVLLQDRHIWKLSEKILVTGFTVHFFFGLIDAFRYNIEKYLIADEANVGTTYMQYGLLIMIILMLYSYIVRTAELIRGKAEEETWKIMAYTDELTGLSNRASFNQMLHDVSDEKLEYTMIVFDLNGLKYVNDNYTHIAGDKYILDFAKLLKKNFSTASLVARVGGDEFVALMKSASLEDIHTILAHLKEDEERISKVQPVIMSCAYGIAEVSEVESHDFEDVIKLADRRMYDMKAKYYSENGLDRRR